MDQHVAFNDRAATGMSAGNATTVPMRRAAPPSPEATPTVPAAPTTRASRRAGGAKRRKVPHACAFCRRSRMSCDEARPCQRCIKRQIAHLCYDEPRSATVAAEAAHAAALAAAKAAASAGSSSSSGTASASPSLADHQHQHGQHGHHHHVHGPGCAHDHDHAHAHDATNTVPHAYSHPGHPSELRRAVVTSHAHMLPPPHHGHPMPSIDYQRLNASMSSPMMMTESGLPTPTYAPPLLTLPPASSPVVSDASSSQDLLAYLASPTSTSSMATPPLGLAPQGMGHALFAAFGSFGSATPMNIFGGERTSAPSPSPPALDLSSLLLSSAPSTPTPSLAPVTSGSGASMLGLASDFTMFSTLFDALEPVVTTSTTLPEPVLAAPPVTVASQSLPTTQSSAMAPMLALTAMSTMPQQPPMTPTTATAPTMSSQVFASPVSIQSSVRQGPSPTPSTPTDESAPAITNATSSSTQDSTVDEAFLLSVADPTADTTAARLQQVIQAKFAAGLLRPHNYAQGYARLAAYADAHFSPSAKQRIITATKSFRPTFRAIASTMTPLDHVLGEEMFDRLLLDYDRLFAAMAVPACLWRRTGEIYKANQPFADLVGIPLEKLKNGKVTIYELMAEEAAVNYWEKFAGVAGDPGQKAVLTSCVLVKQMVRSRPTSPVLAAVNLNLAAPTGAAAAMAMARALRSNPTSPILRPRSPTGKSGNGSVSCCFSFTVRRDKNQVPIAIVGNFLPTQGARL